MSKVAITGLGAITSHGADYNEIFTCITNGQSGIKKLNFENHNLKCNIGGPVFENFSPDSCISKTEQRKMDPYAIYGLIAAIKAWTDSGLDSYPQLDHENVAIVVGSGIGGLHEMYNNVMRTVEYGMHRVSPFFIPKTLTNMLAGHIAQFLHINGPSSAVVSACATGAHAIGEGMRMIQRGEADIAICGGSEAAIHPLGIAGFSAAGALSTNFNDIPEEASRPWDKDRDGFVMSDGAAILVLENIEHAKNRDARIHGYVSGYGASSDAYHMTSPSQNGEGAQLAMKKAIKDASISPEDIGYINAHATSTEIGDAAEITAIQAVFNGHSEKLKISGTKSCTGHLLGASGSLEAILTVLSLQNKTAPPTINLKKVDLPQAIRMNLVPNYAQEIDTTYALSNSFGFGGMNAALVFSAV